jgi:hypothetical protein
MSLSRRSFLTATAGTAVGMGGVALALPGTAQACAKLHQAMLVESAKLSRDARLAGSNILTTLRDIACPCCGEPFELFKDFSV